MFWGSPKAISKQNPIESDFKKPNNYHTGYTVTVILLALATAKVSMAMALPDVSVIVEKTQARLGNILLMSSGYSCRFVIIFMTRIQLE